MVEDESRLIGRCAQPEIFFDVLRSSVVALVEETLQSRVQVTFDDYILASAIGQGFSEAGMEIFARYRKSLQAISKKLGGLRFTAIEKDLTVAEQAYEHGDLEPNRVWIAKLLEHYYDPLYYNSLHRREPKFVFRGSRSEILEWLRAEIIQVF